MSAELQKQLDVPRFWSKVQKQENGCWIWTASGCQGYGHFHLIGSNKIIRANRASWIIKHGSLDPKMKVLHRCDDSRCVNPDHLFLGTQAENNADMKAKGRASRSSDRHRKITDDQVREIRRLRAKGHTYREISELLSVTRGCVEGVATGRRFKSVA